MKNTALVALSKGFLDGGSKFSSNFPGFYSHQLHSLLGGKSISVDERSAYAEAFGASLGGSRAICSIKNVGLNIASDPFLSSIISGVNAGLVLVVTDDVQMWGSQHRQDTRHYRDFYGGLWLEPDSPQRAYDLAYDAHAWSEDLDVPVVIRLTNQFFKLVGEFKSKPKKRLSIAQHNRDPKKYIVHPMHWRGQHARLAKKRKRISKFIDELYKDVNCDGEPDGAIVFGCCQSELDNAGESWDTMEIYSYPVPQSKVLQFLNAKKKVHVFEQGDNYGRKLVSSAISKKSGNNNITGETGEVPDLSGSYKAWPRLEKLFKALRKVKPSSLISDVTQFTVENTHTVDACLSLGTALPTAHGLSGGAKGYPFVVVGDTSLVHGGLGYLEYLKKHKSKMGIVIVDNGVSWCTGGQGTSVSLDLDKYGIPFTSIDYIKTTQKKLEDFLSDMKKLDKLSILQIKTPVGSFER